jgi:hypothetical protein
MYFLLKWCVQTVDFVGTAFESGYNCKKANILIEK